MTPTTVINSQTLHLHRHLWRNSWLVGGVIFILSWLYQLATGAAVNWYSLSKALAGTGAVLIAASFALSGFCYYFDFLDTKLGYRKYLGLIGFYFSLGYAVSLVILYPELYGWGLFSRLNQAEVILGLAAMVILTGMAIISNPKIMLKMGVSVWRHCLRLGYLAMLLLVIRAYLLESEWWWSWLQQPDGLPPGRLLLSVIDLGVIGLRGSMIINQWRHRWFKKSHPMSVTQPPANLGTIKLPLLLFGLAVVLSVYLVYGLLTVRPVVAPSPPDSSTSPAANDQLQPPVTIPVPSTKPQTDPALSFLNLPAGFAIQIFAHDLSPSILSRPGPAGGPRLMTVVADETVLVAIPAQGKILALRDTDGDGRSDWRQDFISDLRRPHNVAYNEGWYYIAAEDGVFRVRDANNDWRADGQSLEKLVSLPSGGHWTRTVKIIKGQMYISVGSSCNVCQETNKMRAAITRCQLDGTACVTFARGLRNTVDFVEYEGQIYGTDNGRDNLGNDLPPEEINLIKEDGNYGWPICYGQRVHDTDFDQNVYVRDPCADTIPPEVELPAHIAPLGLEFYKGDDFPADYQGDLFVASHGSWNRQPPAGYKIYRLDWPTKKVSDFISGWLDGGVVHGRPVGVVNYQGGLLISDDAAGVIYLVRYVD